MTPEEFSAAAATARGKADRHEAALTAAWLTVLRKMTKDIRRAFVKHGPLTSAADPPRWVMPHSSDLQSAIDVKIAAAGTTKVRVRAATTVVNHVSSELGVSFDQSQALLAGVIEGQSGTMIQHVTQTWTDSAMVSLQDSYDKGLSVPRAARAMTRRMGDLSGARARTIARTELIGATNGSTLAMAQMVGAGRNKVWVATEDERTRESHAEIDGETVGIEDQFSNGLAFPGDPSGEPEEVINCRCTLDFTDDETAPGGGSDTFALPSAASFDTSGYSAIPDEGHVRAQERVLKGTYATPVSRDALETYTEGSDTVNKYLRGQMPEAGESVKRQVRGLDKLMTPTSEKTVVYRAIPKTLAQDLKVGDVYTDKGYASTTWDKEYAPHVLPNTDVLKVYVPEGTPALNISATNVANGLEDMHAYERELVLGRGTSFEVVSREGNELAVRVVPIGEAPRAPVAEATTGPKFAKHYDWEDVAFGGASQELAPGEWAEISGTHPTWGIGLRGKMTNVDGIEVFVEDHYLTGQAGRDDYAEVVKSLRRYTDHLSQVERSKLTSYHVMGQNAPSAIYGDMRVGATGGRGQLTWWLRRPDAIRDYQSTVDGTFFHEMGHLIGGNGGAPFEELPAWERAIEADKQASKKSTWAAGRETMGNGSPVNQGQSGSTLTLGSKSVTRYGETNLFEDWAESYRLWRTGIATTGKEEAILNVAMRKPNGFLEPVSLTFRDLFPNRAAIFERLYGAPARTAERTVTTAPKVEKVAKVTGNVADRNAELERRYLAGDTIASIARDTGLSSTRVRGILKERRVLGTVEKEGKVVKVQGSLADRDADIVRRRNAGESLRSIADSTGLSLSRITKIIRAGRG